MNKQEIYQQYKTATNKGDKQINMNVAYQKQIEYSPLNMNQPGYNNDTQRKIQYHQQDGRNAQFFKDNQPNKVHTEMNYQNHPATTSVAQVRVVYNL